MNNEKKKFDMKRFGVVTSLGVAVLLILAGIIFAWNGKATSFVEFALDKWIYIAVTECGVVGGVGIASAVKPQDKGGEKNE